ncbi:phenylalanine--tRNA ligase subunit alpha, partial [candidate division WWE3 bacterium]|nr:phenylalanine--tRNA ligase subunit alpha [candidate division WWE3 bacterium]
CRVCKWRGWLEILGSGMVHRKLLEKCGIDYKVWGGFAFGIGLDRVVMSRYSINDIRHLHGGNLVYEDSL